MWSPAGLLSGCSVVSIGWPSQEAYNRELAQVQKL
jgi:hypothetical protein